MGGAGRRAPPFSSPGVPDQATRATTPGKRSVIDSRGLARDWAGTCHFRTEAIIARWHDCANEPLDDREACCIPRRPLDERRPPRKSDLEGRESTTEVKP